MSLEIRNAPGQPGHALLVFNRNLDVGSLKLAILNKMSRKYLGPSVGKANWSPARSHFFEATLVSRAEGETVFKIGPEVVSFIPDEATIEFTNEDNTICEQVIWGGIMLPGVWTVTEANPDNEAAAARERDHQRRERADAEMRVREAAMQRQRQEAELERQRFEAETQREREEAERRRVEAVERQKREDAERQRRDAEMQQQREADAKRQRVEAERQISLKQAQDLREREEAEAEAKRAASIEEMAGLARGIARGTDGRNANEVEAERIRQEQEQGPRYPRTAEAGETEGEASGAKLLPASAEAAEVGDDNAAIATVSDEASSAGRQNRLRAFALVAAIVAVLLAMIWASQNESYLCGRFGTFCHAETVAFDAAVTCAKYKTCGANECIADYRRNYPTGAHKAQIDQIADTKGMACLNRQSAPYDDAAACAKGLVTCLDPEKGSFDRASACAAAKTCGVGECVSDYRRNYPLGRFKAQIDQMVRTKGAACQDTERASFDSASACAASRTCAVDECFANHRRNYPSGRFKAQLDQIVQTKAGACWDAEPSNFDLASSCVASRTCGAEECAADYRRFYPSGRFQAQLDQLIASKVQACSDLEKRFDKGRSSKERRR
jgi:hypothetical protein